MISSVPGGRPVALRWAALQPQSGPGGFRDVVRDARHATHRGHARQRLTAEPERGDVLQIGRTLQLAGRVTFEGELNFVAEDAAAVVADADQGRSALARFHVHAGSAGVQAVFHQFLHNGSRPLDNFPGSDAGCDVFG